MEQQIVAAIEAYEESNKTYEKFTEAYEEVNKDFKRISLVHKEAGQKVMSAYKEVKKARKELYRLTLTSDLKNLFHDMDCTCGYRYRIK